MHRDSGVVVDIKEAEAEVEVDKDTGTEVK
jgi:hypothetical protein